MVDGGRLVIALGGNAIAAEAFEGRGAALRFAEQGGDEPVSTALSRLRARLEGTAGTVFDHELPEPCPTT